MNIERAPIVKGTVIESEGGRSSFRPPRVVDTSWMATLSEVRVEVGNSCLSIVYRSMRVRSTLVNLIHVVLQDGQERPQQGETHGEKYLEWQGWTRVGEKTEPFVHPRHNWRKGAPRFFLKYDLTGQIRNSNILSAAARLAEKQAGRANVQTLVAMKGALKRPDLGRAYYEAVVRPSREPVPTELQDDTMETEEDDEEARKESKPNAGQGSNVNNDDADDGYKVYSALPKRRRISAKLCRKLNRPGVFSGRRLASKRPPKPVARF